MKGENLENIQKFQYNLFKVVVDTLSYGSHHCNNFHHSGVFGATIFIPLMEDQSDNFKKLSLHLRVIYQNNNYQNFLIFITLKYRSDMLVQRNTNHGILSSIKLVKFCLFFIRKSILCKVILCDRSNAVEVGNLIC